MSTWIITWQTLSGTRKSITVHSPRTMEMLVSTLQEDSSATNIRVSTTYPSFNRLEIQYPER